MSPIMVFDSDTYNARSICVAFIHGHESIVKLLLEYKAGPNTKTEMGEVPLTLAIRHGHFSVARLLLAQENMEVNPGIDYFGRWPLSVALSAG